MFIVGDILLFITTALVLSITCLCILLFVRARDAYTKGFLTILVPLCLQMVLNMLLTYINRVYPSQTLTGPVYEIFCLCTTFVSIFLTTALLYTVSRYLVDLLPATDHQKRIGYTAIHVVIAVFLFLSLFLIIARSGGNWILAMNLTLGYHFFSGSMLMTLHGITSMSYRRKATSWEQKTLLNGISATFLPLLVTFPLDLLFFRNHPFKLAYLSFSVFVVYHYFFINRQYFHAYERPVDTLEVDAAFFREHGISPREIEIVRLLVAGKTNQEIGDQLYISGNTVKTHIKNIYGKLQVSTRVQLFALLRGKQP